MHVSIPLLKHSALRLEQWQTPERQTITVMCKVFDGAGEDACQESYLHRYASSVSSSVVRYYEQSLVGGVLMIRMECCARGSLEASLAQNKQHESYYSQDYLLYIAFTLLQLLIALKGARIAHRAINPGNLLIAENWEIKLTDFGAAKLVEEGKSVEVHTLRGNFGPEEGKLANTLECAEIDPFRADLYALGAVLYAMVTLKAPRYNEGISLDLLELDINAKVTRAGCPLLGPLLVRLMHTRNRQRISAEEALALIDSSRQLDSSIRMSECDSDVTYVTEVISTESGHSSAKKTGLACERCQNHIQVPCRALNCTHILCDNCVRQFSQGQREVVCKVCDARADSAILQRRRDLTVAEKQFWIGIITSDETMKMQRAQCPTCHSLTCPPEGSKSAGSSFCQGCSIPKDL